MGILIFYDDGIRKAVKKTCGGTSQGVLAFVHLSVHGSDGLCIVSTYRSFAIKREDTLQGVLFLCKQMVKSEKAAVRGMGIVYSPDIIPYN